jgi:hypothetical protein
MLGIALPALGAGDMAPGAYCPFPEPGQKPACMDPARERYGELFEALDEGQVDDAQLQALEADVAAGAGSADAYTALSSITFVYYRIAQQAASAPDQDPVVVGRLARLNELLAGAYQASDDPEYRDAMRTAARDLEQRAPSVAFECSDKNGQPAECGATEDLLRRYANASEQIGIRGALRKLLERFTGGSGT